jgi:hypothetical protein
MRELTTLELDVELAEQLPARELMSVFLFSRIVVVGNGNGNGNANGNTLFSIASVLNGNNDGNGNGNVHIG